MKKPLTTLSVLLLFVAIFGACKNREFNVSYNLYTEEEFATISAHLNLTQDPVNYDFNFPSYYLGGTLRSTTNEAATLGRVIFYDKNLSKDRSKSCASCHKQALAFSDDVPLSEGIEGRRTDRNSLALGSVFNFAEYYGSPTSNRIPFMWDNRATSVAEQSRGTFANSNEMGMDMHEVVSRVRAQEYYQPLFTKAFGAERISEDLVLRALTSFINSMSQVNSTFDQELSKLTGKNGLVASVEVYNDFGGYSVSENAGKALFLANCSSCHGRIMEPTPIIASNNGLSTQYQDRGVGALSNQPEEVGLFKVPPLRSIALTAPYMHDGRFATLEEVLDHYSSNIQNHPNLGAQLRNPLNNQPRRFDFSDQDKRDIIAFLHTLTDHSVLTQERFSDPFLK
ncbi:MAG: cytochrome c peroxidase [Bacteroidota bacterium]